MTRAFPALLQPAPDQDLPPPQRARDGRHGGADPDQERSRPPTTRRWTRCAPTSCARPATGMTAPGSRIPAWCRSPRRFSTSRCRRPNQIARKRQDVHVTAADLLDGARRARSPRRACARTSMSGIGYLEAWLRGIGCVPLYNLMEDAATAEISRAQVWQWIRHQAQARRRPHRRSRSAQENAWTRN